MLIIDSQVHAPHLTVADGLDPAAADAARAEALLAAMDAVGVAAAVIAPRYDAEFGEAAAARHPGRLARVVMLDPAAPDLDDQMARLRQTPGVVGLRQVVGDYAGDRGTQDLQAGVFDALLGAAERHGMPFFALAPGFPADMALIAQFWPDLPLILDHLGLRQYPPLSMDADPWDKFPHLLALARFPNVHVKLCGAQLLSAEPYPHPDIRPHLARLVDAFGPDRLMWASDFTRLRMVPAGTPWRGTYGDALHVIRDSGQFSADETATILGGTARRILAWPR